MKVMASLRNFDPGGLNPRSRCSAKTTISPSFGLGISSPNPDRHPITSFGSRFPIFTQSLRKASSTLVGSQSALKTVPMATKEKITNKLTHRALTEWLKGSINSPNICQVTKGVC